jgi:hypothetical protein
MFKNFAPFKSAADAAVLIGAAGLVTGFGGKYLFVVPIFDKWDNPMGNSGWGIPSAPWFSTRYPWVELGKKGEGTTDVLYQLRAYLMIITNTPWGFWGINKAPTDFCIGPQYDDATIFNSTGVGCLGATITPGPLGEYGGFIFIGLFAGGIIARTYLQYGKNIKKL